MLDQITPVILTYNEAPNIGRTLERLDWARDIVVVDSFSDDETLAIVSNHPRARAFQRKFDMLKNQWNFALKETGIETEWVLALDADYLLTPDLLDELKVLAPEHRTRGYRARFVYCVEGQPLRGSAYPPVTVLYRRDNATYEQDGHAQRVSVGGEVENLRSIILHDDRKPLGRWLQSQYRYMELEAEKLSAADMRQLSLSDRLRKMRVLAPFVMLFYCLLFKRAILDGRAGIYYTFQRAFAELLLSLHLLERDLKKPFDR
jgi:glycosyltransferase involved in cell wall biosynthesis